MVVCVEFCGPGLNMEKQATHIPIALSHTTPCVLAVESRLHRALRLGTGHLESQEVEASNGQGLAIISRYK